MMYDTAAPYIASFVIIRQDDKIAFVLRSKTQWMNHFYGLPSGKVEKHEPFQAAAIREAKEEIGIEIKPDSLSHVLTMHRHEPSEYAMDWVDVFFEVGKWSGTPTNAEPEMHSELAWLDPQNLPENVVPSVRFALEQIEAGKPYAEYGWPIS